MNAQPETKIVRRVSLINRSAVRKEALEQSRLQRLGRFTRVSEEFLDAMERVLREVIAGRVHRAPSKGKTL